MTDSQTTTPEEVWKAIPGYEGYYDGSNQGRIRSYWQRIYLGKYGSRVVLNNIPQKLLKYKVDRRSGYFVVGLHKDGKSKSFWVHKIILITFRGPCPPGMEGCHNDGVPLNIHIDNLRWDTHRNNILDRQKHGTNINGERNGQAKLTEINVRYAKNLLEQGLSQGKIGKILGVSQTSIHKIATGKKWAHLL